MADFLYTRDCEITLSMTILKNETRLIENIVATRTVDQSLDLRLISKSTIILCWKAMSESVSDSTTLFKPLLVAGIIVGAFGIICIWIDTSIISPKEEGDGFKIIGIRFLISSMVSIGLGFIAKYFIIIKYILRQISYKIKPDENKFSGWDRP